MGYAEVVGAFDLFVGVNAVDYSGYPDCRPEFVRAFEAVSAKLATKGRRRGRPLPRPRTLIDLTKADIIRLGGSLSVDYTYTHSCYAPAANGGACGRCDSCQIHRAASPPPASPIRPAMPEGLRQVRERESYEDR